METALIVIVKLLKRMLGISRALSYYIFADKLNSASLPVT